MNIFVDENGEQTDEFLHAIAGMQRHLSGGDGIDGALCQFLPSPHRCGGFASKSGLGNGQSHRWSTRSS